MQILNKTNQLKMKNNVLLFAIVLFFGFLGTNINAQFAGGDGSQSNPWQITTIAELDSVRNHLDGNFVLMNDLIFSAGDFEKGGNYYNDSTGWNPLSTSDNVFKGQLNGKGHTIQNLYINLPDSNYVGLFGRIDSTRIDSLGLINVNITGKDIVGSITGRLNYSTMYSCYCSGTISGNKYVGGLVGYIYNYSTVSISYNSANVSGTGEITGGIVGYSNNHSTVSNCYNAGKISGISKVGGLIGETYTATTKNSFNLGEISANLYIGGLVGRNYYYSNITSCYNTGHISGGSYAGGLTGIHDRSGQITFCYNTGNITGSSYIGGLAGQNYYNTYIYNSYNTGFVSGNSKVGGAIGDNISGRIYYSYSAGIVTGKSYTGGLLGKHTIVARCINSYWDKDGSGMSISAAGKGLTMPEMKQDSNFVDWDFSTNWKLSQGVTYPVLRKISDNAPFAFADIVYAGTAGSSYSLNTSTLLANDLDYETGQTSLTLKVESLSNGSYLNGMVLIPEYEQVDTITLYYRVGEIRSSKNDTLWGNTTRCFIIVENSAPEWHVDTLIIREEKQLYITLDSLAGDIDGDSLRYSIATSAKNGTTQLNGNNLNYISEKGFIGLDSLEVIVSDGELNNSGWLYIQVTANNAPKITSTAPTLATVGVKYSYTVITSDEDSDELTYTLNNAPTGMKTDTNIITWIPVSGTSTSGEITLIVSDGIASATETFTIDVFENHAPKITSTAPTSATIGVEYSYTVTANDEDGDELTYSLNNEPTGMKIDANIITWTPVSGTSTSGEVTLIVSDGIANATETFTINTGTSETEYTEDGHLAIYPNPVSSILTVKCSSTIEAIKIFSTTGSILLTEIVYDTEKLLNIQNLQKGIYIVKIKTNEGTLVRRIVKE